MTARKLTLLTASAAVLSLYACKKTSDFTYKAACTDCVISYYDENGNFIQEEPHQGNFEKQITVPRFGNVMIAVQSRVYPDSASSSRPWDTRMSACSSSIC